MWFACLDVIIELKQDDADIDFKTGVPGILLPVFILSETVIPHIKVSLNLFFLPFLPLKTLVEFQNCLVFSSPQLAPQTLKCACGACLIPQGGQEVRFNFSSDPEPSGRKQQLEYQSAAI